jgi:predicted GNAT family N-acyltransferase
VSGPVEIGLRTASWDADRAGIEAVRYRVFALEQGVPEHEEWDDADPVSRHVLAVTPKRDAVGTARLEPAGKIGRVAVLPQYRGTGIGGAMVSHLVDLARTLGLTQVHLNSQSSAIGFYARLGFRAEGPEFVEVGIPHRRMVLQIGHRDEEQAERHRDTEHSDDRR